MNYKPKNKCLIKDNKTKSVDILAESLLERVKIQ